MKTLSKLSLLLTMVVASGYVLGQDPVSQSKVSEVPAAYVSVLQVVDPKCPIRIAGPTTVIGYSNGALDIGFPIKNASGLQVESFAVQQWDWFGRRGYDVTFKVNDLKPFYPGETRSSIDVSVKRTLIPFEENSLLMEKIRNPRNRYWIIMVSEVLLSDGTVYDASPEIEKLERFLSESDESILSRPQELGRWESEVKQFVAQLMPGSPPARAKKPVR